ncbi:hypothetical protein [Nocardiopsis trehalosi]|uniref:hypothetical protein n=1 Tax=Nocardiopsis trehalosi TaxID=109329 RepID=UPI0012F7FBD8|nr:hypothetical protein [Nocardiopsis trehalosi]
MPSLRRLVAGGATVMEVMRAFKESEACVTSPLNFIMVMRNDLGMPLGESRRILEVFDPQLDPLVPEDEVDAAYGHFLDKYRACDGGSSF